MEKKYTAADFLRLVTEEELSEAASLAKRLDELEGRFASVVEKATAEFNRLLEEATAEFSKRTAGQTLLTVEIRKLVEDSVHAKFEAEGNEMAKEIYGACVRQVLKQLGRGL